MLRAALTLPRRSIEPSRGVATRKEAILKTALSFLCSLLLSAPLVADPLGYFRQPVPCRVLDTRGMGPAVPANSIFNVEVRAGDSWIAQGGSAGCHSFVGAVVVVANLTVVEPDRDGFTVAFPYNGQFPFIANMNYRAGQTVNAQLAIELGAPRQNFDFSIFSVAAVHYTLDLIAYYDD